MTDTPARVRVRVTKVHVDVERDVELRDTASVASFSGFTGRCPGGRIIAKGYICIHCNNSDPDEPGSCQKPLDAEVEKLKRRLETVPKTKFQGGYQPDSSEHGPPPSGGSGVRPPRK